MSECYECGTMVDAGEARRRRIKIGSSRSLLGTDWRVYYADQVLCQRCAFQYDARRMIVISLVVLAGAIAWLWFG